MSRICNISTQETINLLNKCWMTHDGMWFVHCLQEIGIEKTNRINKSAIKSMSTIEVQRLKRAFGFESNINNFQEFKRFFQCAAHYMIPDFMNASHDFPQENKMTWAFNEKRCFAYKGIMRLGVIEDYECGVLYRIRCWIEGLGIRSEFNPEIGRCHMHYTGNCSGGITLHFQDL